MTGSMLIQGKRNKIVLLIKEDDKIEANLPPEYRTNDFYGDLTFALVTAKTSRSPIKSEIEFLEKFIQLYDAQVEEGKAPAGKEFIPEEPLKVNTPPVEIESPVPPEAPLKENPFISEDYRQALKAEDSSAPAKPEEVVQMTLFPPNSSDKTSDLADKIAELRSKLNTNPVTDELNDLASKEETLSGTDS